MEIWSVENRESRQEMEEEECGNWKRRTVMSADKNTKLTFLRIIKIFENKLT